MYKRQKKSWVKHLDFLILDLLCLETALYTSCLIRLGNIRRLPLLMDYYNRLAVVLLLVDICVVFFFEAYTGILRRNKIQELKAVIVHCSIILQRLLYMYGRPNSRKFIPGRLFLCSGDLP